MIDRFEVRNFGCLKETSLALTRVHALVGPNDSGKSTLLAALHEARLIEVGRAPAQTFDGRLSNKTQLMVSRAGQTGTYRLDGGALHVTVAQPGRSDQSHIYMQATALPPAPQSDVRGPLRVRFDADALRQNSSLIPDSQSLRFLSDRGAGLPAVYHRILGRGDEAFGRIRADVQRLFPTVDRVSFPAITQSELTIEVHLRDGARVPAEHISEGLLYYLAFAALPFVSPTSLLLVEEPENGLHPARIREVVAMLRTFAEEQDAQVVMATHSPLVVNELAPDEVSVVTRSLDHGTKVTPLTETKDFARRSKVYSPGELWIAYADGEMEAELSVEVSAATGTDP